MSQNQLPRAELFLRLPFLYDGGGGIQSGFAIIHLVHESQYIEGTFRVLAWAAKRDIRTDLRPRLVLYAF